MEVLEYMGAFSQDFRAGGGIPPYLRHFLQGVSSGDPPVWISDQGDEPNNVEEPQGIIETVWPAVL